MVFSIVPRGRYFWFRKKNRPKRKWGKPLEATVWNSFGADSPVPAVRKPAASRHSIGERAPLIPITYIYKASQGNMTDFLP